MQWMMNASIVLLLLATLVASSFASLLDKKWLDNTTQGARATTEYQALRFKHAHERIKHNTAEVEDPADTSYQPL
jgi:hypothetical protein